MSEQRSLPVPDGLAGERVDAAIAKLLGFSRSFAADVVAAGGVRVDGVEVGKSDRLHADSWLEVEWSPKEPPRIVPVEVPGMHVVHDDEDIVVVDKPIGVAAHPSPGCTARPSPVASPRPASPSRRPVPPSGRASCTGSTSARRA